MDVLEKIFGKPEPWTATWFESTPLTFVAGFGVIVAVAALVVSYRNLRHIRSESMRSDRNERMTTIHQILDVWEIPAEYINLIGIFIHDNSMLFEADSESVSRTIREKKIEYTVEYIQLRKYLHEALSWHSMLCDFYLSTHHTMEHSDGLQVVLISDSNIISRFGKIKERFSIINCEFVDKIEELLVDIPSDLPLRRALTKRIREINSLVGVSLR